MAWQPEKVAAALFALALATPALAQETTPAMVAAAEKEGKVVWYTAVDVKVAEAVAKAFRAAYPKIAVDVERSGSERVFQRINQEYTSGIKAVDVVNSSDASHFLLWKQQKWLASHTPPDARRFDAKYRDPDGYYHTWRALLSVAGYNTSLGPEKDAPQSYPDLLDPNGTRVFQNFIYTAPVQQLLVNEGGQRSMHPDVKEPAGRTPLKDIKLLPDDPQSMLPQIAEIKKKYTALFGN